MAMLPPSTSSFMRKKSSKQKQVNITMDCPSSNFLATSKSLILNNTTDSSRRSKRFRCKVLNYWDFEHITNVTTSEGNLTVVSKDVPGEGTFILQNEDAHLVDLPKETISAKLKQPKNNKAPTKASHNLIEENSSAGSKKVAGKSSLPKEGDGKRSMSSDELGSLRLSKTLKRNVSKTESMDNSTYDNGKKQKKSNVEVLFSSKKYKTTNKFSKNSSTSSNVKEIKNRKGSRFERCIFNSQETSDNNNHTKRKKSSTSKELNKENVESPKSSSSGTEDENVSEVVKKKASYHAINNKEKKDITKSDSDSLKLNFLKKPAKWTKSPSDILHTSYTALDTRGKQKPSVNSAELEHKQNDHNDINETHSNEAADVQMLSEDTDADTVRYETSDNEGVRDNTADEQPKSDVNDYDANVNIDNDGNDIDIVDNDTVSVDIANRKIEKNINITQDVCMIDIMEKEQSVPTTADSNSSNTASGEKVQSTQGDPGYATSSRSRYSLALGESLNFVPIRPLGSTDAATGEFSFARGLTKERTVAFFLHIQTGYVTFKTPGKTIFMGLSGEGMLKQLNPGAISVSTKVRQNTELHADKDALVMISIDEMCQSFTICLLVTAEQTTVDQPPSLCPSS